MSEGYILLVEDDPRDEELTKRSLRKAHVANQVIVVHDGAEALDFLFGEGRADAELPRVVILDLKLPKVDGHEVLRRIRSNERTCNLPVVILSSSTEQRDIIEGYGSGANSYVYKPVDFAEFAEAVRQLGLYWLILNEPTTRGR